ncbi:hypothetical protein UUU_24740 (plasmid) [Klebsiella pneumoniae subsp. pneumoniae DSM 30104 = JCM 1662 = NBRC 14940]|nr:hypothetical protein UUU_24740 [Klebsiella pneumoniae subsp. pneumoniae DSM 30104 = JCM 1662 = NBRC 14940]
MPAVYQHKQVINSSGVNGIKRLIKQDDVCLLKNDPCEERALKLPPDNALSCLFSNPANPTDPNASVSRLRSSIL